VEPEHQVDGLPTVDRRNDQLLGALIERDDDQRRQRSEAPRAKTRRPGERLCGPRNYG